MNGMNQQVVCFAVDPAFEYVAKKVAERDLAALLWTEQFRKVIDRVHRVPSGSEEMFYSRVVTCVLVAEHLGHELGPIFCDADIYREYVKMYFSFSPLPGVSFLDFKRKEKEEKEEFDSELQSTGATSGQTIDEVVSTLVDQFQKKFGCSFADRGNLEEFVCRMFNGLSLDHCESDLQSLFDRLSTLECDSSCFCLAVAFLSLLLDPCTGVRQARVLSDRLRSVGGCSGERMLFDKGRYLGYTVSGTRLLLNDYGRFKTWERYAAYIVRVANDAALGEIKLKFLKTELFPHGCCYLWLFDFPLWLNVFAFVNAPVISSSQLLALTLMGHKIAKRSLHLVKKKLDVSLPVTDQYGWLITREIVSVSYYHVFPALATEGISTTSVYQEICG